MIIIFFNRTLLLDIFQFYLIDKIAFIILYYLLTHN